MKNSNFSDHLIGLSMAIQGLGGNTKGVIKYNKKLPSSKQLQNNPKLHKKYTTSVLLFSLGITLLIPTYYSVLTIFADSPVVKEHIEEQKKSEQITSKQILDLSDTVSKLFFK
jgi:hypothetical protein